jgi:hypothetical protein
MPVKYLFYGIIILVFANVRVVNGILQWNDDIDFSPDTLYLESKPVN